MFQYIFLVSQTFFLFIYFSFLDDQGYRRRKYLISNITIIIDLYDIYSPEADMELLLKPKAVPL